MASARATILTLCLPLFAGCGLAFGAGGGVYHEAGVRYDPYPPDAAIRYDRGARPGARLPVPRGHLPPPGACRVWLPGVPPGHQPGVASCRHLEHRVPPGAWLLHRPYRTPSLVELLVYDAVRPRVTLRYLYDARTGRRYRGDPYGYGYGGGR